MRIVLLTGSLQIGGAERLHASLASVFASRGHDVTFLTLDSGRNAPAVQDLLGEVPCRAILSKRHRYPRRLLQLRGAWRPLRRILLELQPSVVYSVLEWTNWLALRAAAGMQEPPAIVLGMASGSASSAWPRCIPDRLLARMQPADGLIANSLDGLSTCRARGVRATIEQVVHAGVDTQRFQVDREGGQRIRREVGVGSGALLVGHVGRLHPVKDHGLLFSAFSNLSTSARLLLVGDGDPSYTEQLRRTARTLGIADRVIWWKRRSDLCAVYSAMNVLALPSVSEGCPNVVMEAMSCGTPCVLTPVGAARQLVGETGIVLADRQPQALAAALSKPLSGQGCRERMEAMFSLDRCADQTLDFLREAVLQRVAMA